MNILGRPDLMDRLAAAYALGTLRGRARRRFESLARSNPELRIAAQVWQERFMSMTELQQAQVPDPNVWKRIENLVAAEVRPRPRAVSAGWSGWLRGHAQQMWRAGAIAGTAAAVVAVAVTLQLRDEVQGQRNQLASLQAQGRELAQQNAQLVASLQAQPDVRYVSVLTDDQAHPAMLVTFDPKRHTIMVKRVGAYQEGDDKSLQLWGLPAAGAPHSLGVLAQQAVLHLPMPPQAGDMPLLAISLEPRGGVPPGSGPTGPVLWKGAVLQTPI